MKRRLSDLFRQHASALTATGITLAVVLWMLTGLFTHEASSHLEAPASDPSDRPVSVRTLVSSEQRIRDRIIITGRTRANRTVAIKARTDGVVEKLHFERGDRISEGQLLAELALEDRQAHLLEARALVEQREIEFRGAKALREQDSISETELAKARAALESARASLEMAVEEAQRTRIRAPIAGLAETRDVNVGDFLGRGAAVTKLVDLTPIRVKGSLSERYLNRVDVGSRATIALVNGSEHVGEVVFVGRVASPATRTFPVEVVIDNPDAEIIEGLTAEITLFTEEVAAHHLPASILTLSDDGALGIKGVNDHNEVVFHPVEVVRDTPDGIWLTGLPEKATVIAVGQAFVSVGQPVETVPYREPTAGGDSR